MSTFRLDRGPRINEQLGTMLTAVRLQSAVITERVFEQKSHKKIPCRGRAVVAHAFNPSTREAEAGGFLSSRSAWSTKLVPGQPELYRETLSRLNK